MFLSAPRRALLGTLAAAATAAVLLPATPAQAAPPRLKVLSHNVFLMSRNLYPNWGQLHRADLIANASFASGNDVVVLQEAFDNEASDRLKANLAGRYPHQTPVVGRSTAGWDATSGNYSGSTPEDGGVTILSKWPIERREQHVFVDACGADWWSNKGFAYVAINVNGVRAHIVGTHLQSTDPGCSAGQAAEIRAKQLRAIDAFLDAKNIPAAEQVLVAGDLNVDHTSGEYPAMLAAGDLAGADTRDGWAYSFDTRDNSIAHYRYPGDPRESLDYVLFRAGHARPAGWRNTVLKAPSPTWSVTSWFTTYTYTDYSDHYPVVGG
ncbi:sphingomyelin phosphodiesterase [Longispora sp. NPDC051575]|uniref:sphingomyelin phosphodiesterase n=1 Tax=Longispora sp. NPDC051575 TaxID=3154943 RepID=UPI003443DB67